MKSATRLYQVGVIYLVTPFVIFSLGWLKTSAGLLFTAILVWVTYRILRAPAENHADDLSRKLKDILPALLLVGIWVALSGVGGYAFQNWDHHWRNAVLRDLIDYEWPVIYAALGTGPKAELPMLTYYIGFWLPAASIGKLWGWEAANLALFLWAWLGVALVGLLLQQRFKTRTLGPILLLIFFSGMDILGMLLRQQINPLPYFSFWPPIHRLENWTTLIQYSSNTTQLFWIYNQAIPTWLCLMLLLSDKQQRYKPFIGALCIFYAPLQAVGLFPFLLLDVFQKLPGPRKASWRQVLDNLKIYINPVNLAAGGLIVITSYLYFSQSLVSARGSATSFNPVLLAIFIMLEGGLLWLLIYPGKAEARWWLTGAVLFIGIFLHNDTFDFGEKLTSAALFMLMIASGDFLARTRPRVLKHIVVAILVLGSATAFYEISRSVILSYQYYTQTPTPLQRWDANKDATYPILSADTSMETALFHPGELVADGIKTITTPQDARWTSNYIGEASDSLFYHLLAKKR